MPAEAYSSLEVLHYDQSANAPHRDHAKYPPELDTAVLAPQVRWKFITPSLATFGWFFEHKGIGWCRSRGSIWHDSTWNSWCGWQERGRFNWKSQIDHFVKSLVFKTNSACNLRSLSSDNCDYRSKYQIWPGFKEIDNACHEVKASGRLYLTTRLDPTDLYSWIVPPAQWQ